MKKIICWNPVYKTGCGWRECPECGPLIEVEIEAEHRKAAAANQPGGVIGAGNSRRNGDWLAEMYGTGESRGESREAGTLPELRKAARRSRAKVREVVRVKRILTAEQRTKALKLLEARPVLKLFRDEDGGTMEWLAECWLELENPSVLVAGREGSRTLEEKVSKAISRAQDAMRKRLKESHRTVYIDDL